jgi:hypothetical protein
MRKLMLLVLLLPGLMAFGALQGCKTDGSSHGSDMHVGSPASPVDGGGSGGAGDENGGCPHGGDGMHDGGGMHGGGGGMPPGGGGHGGHGH